MDPISKGIKSIIICHEIESMSNIAMKHCAKLLIKFSIDNLITYKENELNDDIPMFCCLSEIR